MREKGKTKNVSVVYLLLFCIFYILFTYLIFSPKFPDHPGKIIPHNTNPPSKSKFPDFLQQILFFKFLPPTPKFRGGAWSVVTKTHPYYLAIVHLQNNVFKRFRVFETFLYGITLVNGFTFYQLIECFINMKIISRFIIYFNTKYFFLFTFCNWIILQNIFYALTFNHYQVVFIGIIFNLVMKKPLT